MYKTYEEWLADNPPATAYKRRIVRLHAKHPDATLSQLRGHAKKDEHKLNIAKTQPDKSGKKEVNA